MPEQSCQLFRDPELGEFVRSRGLWRGLPVIVKKLTSCSVEVPSTRCGCMRAGKKRDRFPSIAGT